MTDKPAIHASMLSTLSKCGMQAYYRYVEGLKSPPGVAMVIGTAVDRTGSDNALHKMAHGEGQSVEAVRDLASSFLESTWEAEEPELDDEEKSKGRVAVKGETKDMVIRLAELEATELLPQIVPISVQKKRRLELPGFPFDLEGGTDFETKNSLDDRKCVGKTPSEDRAIGDPQLDFYTLLRDKHGEGKPQFVKVHSLVKLKKGPKLVTASAPSTPHYDSIIKRIERAALVFKTGAFMPVDPQGIGGFICCQHYCGYWKSRCPHGARARVSVSMSTKEQ